MKNLYFISLLILFSLGSCQKEEMEITDTENEQEYLLPNSTLAGLLYSMSLKDGSHDNAVDSTSLLSINFPIEVQLNEEQQFAITSAEEIEAQIQGYEDDFEIVFPITATTANFTQLTFENEEQLQDFIMQTDATDEDIECIDFQYPFTLSAYNTETESFESITIGSDAELLDFVLGLTVEMLVSFDYPISLTLSSGTQITVNSNEELEDAILSAMGTCDEDDDPYNQDMILPSLLECNWQFFENENLYEFYFFEDGSFEGYSAETGGFMGIWELSIGNEDVMSMEIEEFDLTFEGTWTVSNFQGGSNGYILNFENSAGENIVLEQNCNLQPECSTTITECEIGTEVGYAGFILAENDACMLQLAGMSEEIGVVGYHLSLQDAQTGTNQIISTEPFVNTVQFSQYIYVRVENIETGIYEILVILLVTEDC